MATLKIIDRKDKFLLEVDGSKIPYVTTYELTRKPCGSVLLHLALAMSEVEVETLVLIGVPSTSKLLILLR